MKAAKGFPTLWCGILLLALVSAPLAAQSDVDVFGAFELNFDSPGAKGLGMAGASLATVNDASAAVLNPAGLTAIEEQDVLIEAHQNQPYNRFSVAGPVTFGKGAENKGHNESELTSLGFASYTHPFSKGAVSIYYDRIVNFDTFMKGVGPRVNTSVGELSTDPTQGTIGIDVDSLGVSAAFKAGENFSVGVGVAMQSLSLDASNSRYTRAVPFPPDPFASSREATRQTVTGDDDDMVFNVGVLYKEERWSVGASYRQGGEFELSSRNLGGQGAGALAGVVLGTDKGTFAVPDRYGVGFAFLPTEKFTVSVEWDHVAYSDMLGDLADPYGLGAAAGKLDVDDADTLHLGFEWRQTHPRYPVSIWWGVWKDEGHRVAFRGSANDLDARSAFLASSFFGSDDETHYTVGSGFGLGGTFNVAISGDFSDPGDTIIGAFGARF